MGVTIEKPAEYLRLSPKPSPYIGQMMTGSGLVGSPLPDGTIYFKGGQIEIDAPATCQINKAEWEQIKEWVDRQFEGK